MRAKIKTIVYNPLFSGSMIMILGSNLANMFSYLYHVALGRMLGPVNYGNLEAFLNLVTILSSLYAFMGLVIVKYMSSAKKEDIGGYYQWFFHKGMILGLFGSAVLAVFSNFIANFLHIDQIIVLTVSVVFLISINSFIFKSFLQGRLEFVKLAISVNVEILFRLLLGVMFVALGFSILGAVGGFFAASLIGLTVLFIFVRSYRHGKEKRLRPEKLFSYAFPVFVYSVSSMSLISNDVLLAKHYLGPTDAGIYASLSTLGKIIFFGTAPVSSAMFPIVSKRYSEGKKYINILLLSILMTAGISLSVLALYIFVPSLMVSILFGKAFLSAATYLPLFGVFAAIFAICGLIISFYLSKGRTVFAYLMAGSAVSQFIGITLFHDKLDTIIKVSIVSVSVMLIVLIFFIISEIKNEYKK
jgi:O-antigen/teichoic acid export membrane protein